MAPITLGWAFCIVLGGLATVPPPRQCFLAASPLTAWALALSTASLSTQLHVTPEGLPCPFLPLEGQVPLGRSHWQQHRAGFIGNTKCYFSVPTLPQPQCPDTFPQHWQASTLPPTFLPHTPATHLHTHMPHITPPYSP